MSFLSDNSYEAILEALAQSLNRKYRFEELTTRRLREAIPKESLQGDLGNSNGVDYELTYSVKYQFTSKVIQDILRGLEQSGEPGPVSSMCRRMSEEIIVP